MNINYIEQQGIRPDAGKYSSHQRAIRGVELTLPAPEDIQEEMDRLLRHLNRPQKTDSNAKRASLNSRPNAFRKAIKSSESTENSTSTQ